MNDWWKLSPQEVAGSFSSSLEKGLNREEASSRLKKTGENVLPKKEGRGIWPIIWGQFSSLIIWLLIGAAVVAGFLGEHIDAYAILAIVVLNACLGFVQEFRAEKSLKALQKLAAPVSRVMREGKIDEIPAKEIVPGDVVLLEAGDKIPADGRLFAVAACSIEEAALTGESIPARKQQETIDKDLPLGDRANMAYMGTVMVAGKAKLLVTETASQTEIGKIAGLLSETKGESTPLQKQLGKLGTKLVWICLVIVAIVFALGLWRGQGAFPMLLIALSLAVAAIPEGLPAAVTISLSIGVRKMAEKKALIRRLSSVETLGCTAVICTDKTGTLTQNQMEVRKFWTASEAAMPLVHKIGVVCNDSSLEGHGDPTEIALLQAAKEAGVSLEAPYKEQEFPFDSDRKMMSVFAEKTLYVKGAPDIVLDKSIALFDGEKEVPLTEEKREEIKQELKRMGNEALRVLGLALGKEAKEENLTFVGLVGMIDPPREEVFAALEKCKQAGIRAVMVTGDHKETAMAIGKEIGLMQEGDEALTGAELAGLSEKELEDRIEKISVFARITAGDKLRIIEALKRKQLVTAMTGDGVNDAPAIKKADIGVAMGITGSEVTKEAADMVLLDDHFASLVNAAEAGRGIYDNIIKFVSYLLSSNIAEIAVIFFSMLFVLGGEGFVPLLPVQLLWMNLVTDGFPAVSLALDPIDPTAMKRPPRPKDETILNRRFALFLLAISAVVTVGALSACLYGLLQSPVKAQTMTFTTLIVLELVRVQMIRSQYHLGLGGNPWLLIALASSFLLQLAVLYIPSLEIIFETVPLHLVDWAVIFGIAVGVWFLGKLITTLFESKKTLSP